MVYSKRNGFTLVEVLVVMSIIGVVSAGTAITLNVVTNTNRQSMGQNRALNDVHMTGNSIARDVKNVVRGDDPDDVKLTDGNTLCLLRCSAWDNATGTFVTDNVTYTVDQGVLTRTSERAGSSSVIARYIVGPGPGTTYFYHAEEDPDWYYTLIVTSDYGKSDSSAVTRTYKVMRGYKAGL